MKRTLSYCLPLLICLVVSCKKESDTNVETLPLSEVTSTSVMCNGNASGEKITEKGFCWNTLGDPSVNNNTVKSDGGSGSYNLVLDGLKTNTFYYVRAYCRTKTDIQYGKVISFNTADEPSVISNNYTALNVTSFSASGSVDPKGRTLLSAGICWSTGTTPTINNSKITGTVSNNTFSCTVTGLDSNTVYYYRSYGTFTGGTVYGEQKRVRTFAGRVKDIDGNVYYTIDIGGSIWTTSNLRTSRYRNGNSIAYYASANWYNMPLNTGAYGKYNNSAGGAPFGYYYNFFAVQDARGLAPAGWHIASNAEWNVLQSVLGTTAAQDMKTTGSAYWNVYTNNTNSSGFSVVGAGYRDMYGTDSDFLYGAHFWSSTVASSSGTIMAYIRHINTGDILSQDYYYATYGCSVRCVKD